MMMMMMMISRYEGTLVGFWPPFRYLIRKKTPMSLRDCLPEGLGIIHCRVTGVPRS